MSTAKGNTTYDDSAAGQILCADDSLICRHFYSRVLQRAGYACVCAVDGQAAYELAAADLGRFGLLITDHDMPGLDGLALVTRLRAAGFPGKVVVVSGAVTAADHRAYEPLRVEKILAKPLTAERLLELVAELITDSSRP